MITRLELMEYLNHLLKPEEFEDYAPNGLQVEGRNEISRILVSPSASLTLFEEAVAGNYDAILVHHGLFWKNDPRAVVGPLKQKLELLLKNGINLIGYHLPLDYHPEIGNNHPVLVELGLENLEVLERVGYYGDFAEPLPVTEFIEKLENYYQATGVHIAAPGQDAIRRVALVSGGGIAYLRNAVELGVDAFITGEGAEWSYALARENGVQLSVMGHYTTEKVGVRLLAEKLKNELGLDYQFFAEENPF